MILTFLYNTVPGRVLLKPLVSRPFSELAGRLLDSRLSRVLIDPFVKKNHIDLKDFELDGPESFNDFFCRRLKKGRRDIDMSSEHLISPCDGLLSVYHIDRDSIISVKESRFTIDRLLKDRKLAAVYRGGYALVFRLCVNHYHRYIYFDSGTKSNNRRIDDLYHTVRPVALESFPVFVENTREYTIIDSPSFGPVVQMEVGAMLVGRIVNIDQGPGYVERGVEKGYFEYGGSTIILLIPPERAVLRQDILVAAKDRKEIPVQMGELIGNHLQKGD